MIALVIAVSLRVVVWFVMPLTLMLRSSA